MHAENRLDTRRLCSPLLLLCIWPLFAQGSECDFSVTHRNSVYNYSLAAPTRKYPHGAMSEDGFYKVAVNDTLLWYQLCDQMIFNHGQPRCLNCQDCGGPLLCGMECGALVANNIGGYYVCTTIGQASNVDISLIEKDNPKKGVIFKMFAKGAKENCSLSVTVICDANNVEVSNSFIFSGTCNYATELRHPSGCARIISSHGKGLGWFGTLMIIIFCLLGGYLLVGTIYRYYLLGVHSAEAIPCLEFWLSIPQRASMKSASFKFFWTTMQNMFGLLVQKLQGFLGNHRGSYSPVGEDRGFYSSASY